MKMTRRRILRSAIGGIAGGSLAAIRAAVATDRENRPKAAPGLAIVNTHQHLWDLSKFDLPWLKGAPSINRSFVMKDYLQATAGLNVVKAVYMEVDVVPSQKLAEAEYIVDICRRKEGPTCAAVIGAPIGSEGFRDYITRFRGSPYVKGIRSLLFKPETQGGRYLQKAFLDGLHLLGDLGMSFDICIAASELADAAKLAERCPDTRFVLDHCGNADVKLFRAARTATEARRTVEQWRRDIAALAQRNNVVSKISGIIATAPKGDWTADDLATVVNHCLDSFGPNRVMFASDWPVCTQVATYGQWVHALSDIVHDRSESDQRRLFGENAIDFYGLK